MIVQLVSRGLKYAQRASETRAARRGKQDEATFNDGFQPLHRMRSDVMEKHVSAAHPGKPSLSDRFSRIKRMAVSFLCCMAIPLVLSALFFLPVLLPDTFFRYNNDSNQLVKQVKVRDIQKGSPNYIGDKRPH
jgi:hypothetical protein